MPMIEFRYKSDKVSLLQAKAIGDGLEEALRLAIGNCSRKKGDYNITVEGDPFGPIAYNQPDFRAYVFYHEDWRFTPNDLQCLAAGMGTYIQSQLLKLGLNDVDAVVRCYLRAGHASARVKSS